MYLATFLLILFSLPLFADSQKYKIQLITYQIEGLVRQNALNAVLDWDTQNIFNDKRSLEEYLRNQKQSLINRKIFKSVKIDYNTINDTDGYNALEVFVSIEEAWNIYPVPIYTYDTNYGMITGLNLYYSNFFGTLTDFSITGYYSPLKSELTSAIEGLRIGSFDMDFRFSQLWETVRAVDPEGEINLQYSYIKTIFDTNFQFSLFGFLDYIITPIVYFPYSYDFKINSTGKENSYFEESGFIPAISQKILYDHVNWIGNLRQGINVSLESGINYQSFSNEAVFWNDGIVTTYLYTPVFNYNSRISGFYYFNGYREKSGDRLRGILDYKLTGTKGFFWNQNFVIPVIKIPYVMEMHISPFIDMGYVGDNNDIFYRDDLLYTSGFSATIYPEPVPNVQINVDFGINLNDYSEKELSITSVLYF